MPATLHEYATTWLPRVRARVRAGTLDVYDYALQRAILPTLGPVPITALTRPKVITWVRDLEAGPWAGNTVRQFLSVLRTLLHDALDENVIDQDPTHHVRVRRRCLQGGPIPAKDLADLLLALRVLKPPVWEVAVLLHQTGLRLGEALALTWDEIDVPRAELHVRHTFDPVRHTLGPTKNGRTRIVALTPIALDVLAHRRDTPTGKPWVFGKAGGGGRPARRPYDQSWCQHWFATARRRLELPPAYTLHSLRHTHGTQLIAGGIEQRYVQQQLGHQSDRQTRYYTALAQAPRPAGLDQALMVPHRHPPIPVSGLERADETQTGGRSRARG